MLHLPVSPPPTPVWNAARPRCLVPRAMNRPARGEGIPATRAWTILKSYSTTIHIGVAYFSIDLRRLGV